MTKYKVIVVFESGFVQILDVTSWDKRSAIGAALNEMSAMSRGIVSMTVVYGG